MVPWLRRLHPTKREMGAGTGLCVPKPCEGGVQVWPSQRILYFDDRATPKERREQWFASLNGDSQKGVIGGQANVSLPKPELATNRGQPSVCKQKGVRSGKCTVSTRTDAPKATTIQNKSEGGTLTRVGRPAKDAYARSATYEQGQSR